MARLKFRDRFFTPPVARAMTSPSGILLAGGGLAVGVVVGFPIVAAVGIGAAAWAARVAVAVPREPRKERIDPFTLGEPWRFYVRDALQASNRFEQAVGNVATGPLKERLDDVGDRVEEGVEECWRIARNAQSLTRARKGIDVAGVTSHLSQVNQDASQRWAAGSDLAKTAQALESQLDTAARLDQTISEAEARLQLLNARLDEAVTRTLELSVRSLDSADVRGLQGAVNDVVDEMEALRVALDETDTASPDLELPPQPEPGP